MSDYISRKAAREAFIESAAKNNWTNTRDYGKALDAIPAADVRPVVHGHWIDEGPYADYSNYHAFRCSNCEDHVIEYPEVIKHRKYCQNCGAEMKDSKNNGTITREKLRSMSAGEINRHWEEIQKALKGKRTEGRKQPEEYCWPKMKEGETK